ncbi:protease IV [Myxococcaceae bacterium]|jgi:protease-4|nr:protease IV [Myxococcaceae bacterium]
MRTVRILIVVLLMIVVGGLVLRFAGGHFALASGPVIESGSAVVLDLEGEYVEAPEAPMLARVLGQHRMPLVSVLSELRKAGRDPRVATVIVRIRSLDVGWAKAQDLRDAILAVRDRGKRTVAYLECERFGANREYYVASAADEVWVSPATRSPIVGLAADYLFLGGLWEKLGVAVEVEKIGKYKSAAEAYASTQMSEANAEMANSIMDSIETQLVSAIADRRDLTPSEVRTIIDTAPMTPQDLLDAKLIDGVGYLDEVVEKLGRPPLVEGSAYSAVDPKTIGFAPVATFALIYGTGAVVHGDARSGRSGDPVVASTTISKALLDAAADDSIRAIVFRIDSPGGSALASDVIYHAVVEAKKKKPVVVSFSDVAASGGYYIAAAADAIVAQPATLTGSIGVFVLRPVIGGLLDKLGIGHTSITRGAHADLLLSTQPLSPGTRERLVDEVRSVYDLFVERVASGRSLEPGYVDEVAQGRVWTGVQANERKLVNVLGGLQVAVDRTKERVGLSPEVDVSLLPYPPPEPLAEQIRRLVFEGVSARATLFAPLPDPLRRLAAWLVELPSGSPLLVPPLLIEVR